MWAFFLIFALDEWNLCPRGPVWDTSKIKSRLFNMSDGTLCPLPPASFTVSHVRQHWIACGSYLSCFSPLCLRFSCQSVSGLFLLLIARFDVANSYLLFNSSAPIWLFFLKMKACLPNNLCSQKFLLSEVFPLYSHNPVYVISLTTLFFILIFFRER